MPHEHEVASAVAARLLDGNHVGRRLDRAQQRGVALGRGADRTQLLLREHPAAAATHNRLQGGLQRAGQSVRSRSAFLQEMKRHALRRFGSDARQGTQRVDELCEVRRVFHTLSSAAAKSHAFCRGVKALRPLPAS